MKLPPYSITVVVAGEASGGSEAPNHLGVRGLTAR
jgi:hypothetical protein